MLLKLALQASKGVKIKIVRNGANRTILIFIATDIRLASHIFRKIVSIEARRADIAVERRALKARVMAILETFRVHQSKALSTDSTNLRALASHT